MALSDLIQDVDDAVELLPLRDAQLRAIPSTMREPDAGRRSRRCLPLSSPIPIGLHAWVPML